MSIEVTETVHSGNTEPLPQKPVWQSFWRSMEFRYIACFTAGMAVIATAVTMNTKSDITKVWPTHAPKKAPPGEAAIKTMDERPPDTEDEYRTKFGEAPRRLLYCRPDNRFFTYHEGLRMHWQPVKKDGWEPDWYRGNPR